MNRLVRGHHHLSIRRYFSSVPGLERDCKIRNPSSKRIGLSMYSPLALVISTFPLVRYRPFSGSVSIRNLKRPSWVNSKVAEPFTFNSRLRRFRCVVQTSFLYEAYGSRRAFKFRCGISRRFDATRRWGETP